MSTGTNRGRPYRQRPLWLAGIHPESALHSGSEEWCYNHRVVRELTKYGTAGFEGKTMDLKDTVAIVTGGNGGLGQRICHALAKAGTHLAVVYSRSRDEAQTVADQLRDTGVRAEAMRCDVTVPQQVDVLVSGVLESFGRVDILVNDAAYNKWIPFNDLDAMSYEEWNKIIDTNLTGPMLLTKAVASPMKHEGRGRIVNIASIAGSCPTTAASRPPGARMSR